MTLHAASPDTDFQIRWRNWQTKGVEADRRRAAIMRRVSAALVAGLLVWLAVLLR